MLGTPLTPPFPEGTERPSSGSAVSGAPSGSSGRRRACTPPQRATPVASPRTRRTKRCARADRHAEVVLVVFHPEQIAYEHVRALRLF